MPIVKIPECDVNSIVKIIARTPKGDNVSTVFGNVSEVEVPAKDFDPANEVVIQICDHLGNPDGRHQLYVLQERDNGLDPETKQDTGKTDADDELVASGTVDVDGAANGTVVAAEAGPDGVDAAADDYGLLAELQSEIIASDEPVQSDTTEAVVSAGVNEAVAEPTAEASQVVEDCKNALLDPSPAMSAALSEVGSSGTELIEERGLNGALAAVIQTTDGSSAEISKLVEPADEDLAPKICPKCFQMDRGQVGTEHCPACGLPTVHDFEEEVEEEEPAPGSHLRESDEVREPDPSSQLPSQPERLHVRAVKRGKNKH